MAIVVALLVVGWAAVALIGTQAYFRGEQSKPIHERNWNSNGFEAIATSVTGRETSYRDRVPAYSGDAYTSEMLAK
ncbi:MAG: hypothetical protein F6K04_06770 [Leptolyngbya sp. SIO4C5]|uniref:photosystem II protein, Psb35-related n=1 Tax=Sphaerothrix gracilis TaxID=3151835 RepID=UPI0013BFB70B|nr:hypothetical protein [Leptolyngbya sp. SIO4C5]